MKLHRFFIEPNSIQGKNFILTDKDALNQLKKVLRVSAGDNLILLDNSGKEYRAIIEQLSNSVIKGKVVEVSENKNEPEMKITLHQAIGKKDKFEWVLQKGTEIGVSEFVPIITERTEKLGLNRDRLEKVLKEAAEQSERGRMPKLAEIEKFEDALKSAQGEKILLDRSGESIKTYSSSVSGQLLNVALFIGPEGGYTEQELELAKNSGAKIVSLGKTILRTETAGFAAAAILLNK